MAYHDLTTQRGCLNFLAWHRVICRGFVFALDSGARQLQTMRRCSARYRADGSPLLRRRAETIDADIAKASLFERGIRGMLRLYGGQIVTSADQIDATVPQRVLLDMLGVNAVERIELPADAGLMEIVFVRGIENSAMNRKNAFMEGPIARAVCEHMTHTLRHNEQFRVEADKFLFGKGGMFEFLPMYRDDGSGNLVRQPPKLRLADECDVKD